MLIFSALVVTARQSVTAYSACILWIERNLPFLPQKTIPKLTTKRGRQNHLLNLCLEYFPNNLGFLFSQNDPPKWLRVEMQKQMVFGPSTTANRPTKAVRLKSINQ